MWPGIPEPTRVWLWLFDRCRLVYRVVFWWQRRYTSHMTIMFTYQTPTRHALLAHEKRHLCRRLFHELSTLRKFNMMFVWKQLSCFVLHSVDVQSSSTFLSVVLLLASLNSNNKIITVRMTSCHSAHGVTACIAANHASFSCIRQVAPICNT